MQSWEEHFTHPSLGPLHLRALHWGDRDARPIVLLHGAGANAHWWDHLAPDLAIRFHAVALDFRGHGDSDASDEVLPGAFSDDLAALLSRLGAEDAPLVGHSLGAQVALEHATRSRQTAALVLIDPARGAARGSRRSARLALSLRPSYATREQAEARFRFVPAATAPETLRAAIAARSVRREPSGRFSYKFDPRGFGVATRERPDPSRVCCPSLLLRGAESTLLTHEGARTLAGELPDCRLVEIDGAGHHVQIDRPREALTAMTDFLDEVLPG